MGVKRPEFESDHYFNPVQRLSTELCTYVHSPMPLRLIKPRDNVTFLPFIIDSYVSSQQLETQGRHRLL
jgi:hypothetical protein